MRRYYFIFLVTVMQAGLPAAAKGLMVNTFVAGDTTNFYQPGATRGVHLNGDTISLRFTVYKYFPFINATINGKKGKLMFDTGAETALEIDDKQVSLQEGKTAGNGFVGSGQSFAEHVYDTVENINIANRLTFTNAGPVPGHDFAYMKPITEDILGLVGYQFFQGYLFKLDYKRGSITFYKNTQAREQHRDFLLGEKVIGVLDFQTRKLPNHPVIPMVISTDTLAVSFDTGQLGTLYLTDQAKNHWVENGMLVPDTAGPQAALKSFQFPGGLKVAPGALFLFPPRNAAAPNKAIGITEPNSMTLGYGFLSQYKTVWDYEHKKIYLLER